MIDSPPAEVCSAIDYGRLLDCIQMVEGRKWNSLGGALGWTLAAWHEDSKGLPYRYAQRPDVARMVAVVRLLRLGRELEKKGLKADVRTLAQVWRSGFTGVVSGKPKEPGYGTRVENLYNDR